MSTATGRRAPGLRRRRAVVVNADIADYSRLMADDEAWAVATVRGYQQIVAGAVATARGTLVNFVGDSFVAVFDDAPAAMRAAIAVARAVAERNAGVQVERQMWFRVGVDGGEIVIADDGRYYGDPLNIAARVQAIAEVGGIAVSQAVFDELDEPRLRLVPLGPRRLKNIPEMIRVYQLDGLAGAGHAIGGAPCTDDLTIAITPTIAGDDPTTRRIADALRLDLVQALVRVAGVDIVDGAAVGDRDAVAARYVVEFGLVRSGRRLRAYVEVAETASMNRVWARRWDGTTDDVFALQDAVTSETRRALEIELVVGEPAMFYRSALDGETLDNVYRGWYHLARGNPADWEKATDLFDAIASSRPEAVAGHALAAFGHWFGVIQGWSADPELDLRCAAVSAARGVELDDDTGLSQMVIAGLRLHDGRDLDRALADALASLSRRPTCDVTYGVLGSVQRYLGEWEAAVRACQRALELSPLPKPWYLTVLASAYYVGRRYHEAADMAERVLGRDPGNLEALLVLTAAQQALGLERRARATAAVIADRHPGTRRADLLAVHPFRDATVLTRWTAHLAAAGVP